MGTYFLDGGLTVCVVGGGYLAEWMEVRRGVEGGVGGVVDCVVCSWPAEMVYYDVDHEVHSSGVYGVGEREEIARGAEIGVERVEIVLGVAMVRVSRGSTSWYLLSDGRDPDLESQLAVYTGSDQGMG